MQTRPAAIASLTFVVCASVAHAGTVYRPLTPVSYDMPNGEVGDFEYFDDLYNGSGDNSVPLAPLSGGKGDLLNQQIASANWNITPEPFVGWRSIDPTITFHFDQPYQINAVIVWLDDANGSGGVFEPEFIRYEAGGNVLEIPVPDQGGGGPFSYATDLGIGGFTSDSISVTLIDGDSSRWIMLSEVAFLGVPTPGSAAIAGVAALAALRRRR